MAGRESREVKKRKQHSFYLNHRQGKRVMVTAADPLYLTIGFLSVDQLDKMPSDRSQVPQAEFLL